MLGYAPAINPKPHGPSSCGPVGVLLHPFKPHGQDPLLCSQAAWLREHGCSTLGFKSLCGSSSVTPFPTHPTNGYMGQYSGSFCLSWLPLLVGQAWSCDVQGTASRLHHGLESHPYPWLLAQPLASLKHWPSSLDMPRNSQWPCSASPAPKPG